MGVLFVCFEVFLVILFVCCRSFGFLFLWKHLRCNADSMFEPSSCTWGEILINILSLVSHLHNCSGVPSKATECLLTNTDIGMDLGPQHTSFFNICLCGQGASRFVFLSKDAEGFQFWISRVKISMSFKWWFIAIYSVHKILHRPVRVQSSLFL